ncbi:MAG: hypothetical protein JNK21_11295 [Rhodospirillaceae bacterium]|nr:hypothetical protein [Rhodospirillaceae bacterium]
MKKLRAFLSFVVLYVASAQVAAAQSPAAPATPETLLQRIKMVTVAAPDVAKIEALYTSALGYTVREKGEVPEALARSWGAPKVAGRPYVVLSTDASPDVYIRAVQSAAPADYKPMTSWGWTSFELIVDDIYALHKKLETTAFKVLGAPIPLKSSPSIVTVQVEGPGREIFYFANETGDRSKSNLPQPGAFVGRPFIVILAGRDITAVRDWYADLFLMKKNDIRSSGGKVVPRALGLPDGSSLPISLLGLKEFGNRIQLDGYLDHGVGARQRLDGELPPGNAIVSFTVSSIDAIKAKPLTQPITANSKTLNGLRVATLTGPAGELIELVEEKRP